MARASAAPRPLNSTPIPPLDNGFSAGHGHFNSIELRPARSRAIGLGRPSIPPRLAGTYRTLGRSDDLRDFSMLQACVVQRVLSARDLVFQLPCAVAPSLGAIVAIPVRDEEDRIEACLDALLAQRDLSGRPLPPDALGLVLLLNNCSDRTAAIARGRLAASGTPFALVDVALPPSQANAGFARRLALDLAALWLERTDRRDGVLLTSDADSRVPPQ